MRAIINGRIILPDRVIDNGTIIFDDKIIDIIENGKKTEYAVNEVTDARGDFVSPGFIDLHIHGIEGADIMDGAHGGELMAEALPKYGVTSFLPALITAPFHKIRGIISDIRGKLKNQEGRSEFLGLHLEGPFISKEYCGVHDKQWIRDPDKIFVEEFEDIIKIITIAPECDVNFEFIREMKRRDIITSIGHTGCSAETAVDAVRAGAESFTHLFNAMSGINHRNPGAAAAAITTDVFSELIADNIHVSPFLYNTLLRAKGSDKIILISDATRGCGMGIGKFELGGKTIRSDGTCARDADGRLAGSILTLNKGAANITQAGISIIDAVKMASLNPAKLLRIDNRVGSLAHGKESDIIIFDENFNLVQTFLKGKPFVQKRY